MKKGNPAPQKHYLPPGPPESVLGKDGRNNAIIDSYVKKQQRLAIKVATSFEQLSDESLSRITSKRNRRVTETNRTNDYKNKSGNKERIRRPRKFKRSRAF